MLMVIVEYSEAVLRLPLALPLNLLGFLRFNPVVDFDDVWAADHVKSTSEFAFRAIISPEEVDAGLFERKFNGILQYPR